MGRASKRFWNYVTALEDVSRKEKVVKSRTHESEILGRHFLLGIRRSRMRLRQVIRGRKPRP